MIRPKQALVIAFLLVITTGLLGCSESPGNTGEAETEPEPPAEYTPRVGDVIFQSSEKTALIEMIEGASGSHYSHCGIVDQVDGQWVVYEAADTVTATPLEVFIDRGRGDGFAAYRFKKDYQDDIPTIIEKTRVYLGRPYDFRYRMDDEHIYCSELIYKAFAKSTGQTLGELVRLGDLEWKPYEPLILELESGPPPLDRLIITPIDLALAEQLEVVYSRDFEVTQR